MEMASNDDNKYGMTTQRMMACGGRYPRMSNEALLVLGSLVEDTVALRRACEKSYADLDDCSRRCGALEEERDDLARKVGLLEARLKAEQESGVQSGRAAATARDEATDAQRNLGDWARFINFDVYESLGAALDSRNVKASVAAVRKNMKAFFDKHPITMTAEGCAR